jgi:predicted esterase
MKRRLGRFEVSDGGLRVDGGAFLFNGMKILSIAENPMTKVTEYYAIHPDFDEIGEAELAPTYEAYFPENSIYPKWRKKE